MKSIITLAVVGLSLFSSTLFGQASASAPSTVETPQSGQAWTLADLHLEMKFIQPGTFTMGSPVGEDGRRNDEIPHQVTLTEGYWIGATVVTQAQWTAVMNVNPSHFKGDTLPVERVSWDFAMTFCQKLTEREHAAGRLPPGYIYTLPTEAQWEYACRAGSTGPFYDLGSVPMLPMTAAMWWQENSGDMTHPVGTKAPNAWGLFDMHGNVKEWCRDWYNGDYPDEAAIDPLGPASGRLQQRVLRGGCYDASEDLCRSASRSFAKHDDSDSDRYGFRVALSSTAPIPVPPISIVAWQPPAPVISEDARKHYVRGEALYKIAKTAADYNAAVIEFGQAITAAPSWPDARYDEALTEQAEADNFIASENFAFAETEYKNVVLSLRYYLQLKISDADRRTAMDLMYTMEAKADDAHRKTLTKTATDVQLAVNAAAKLPHFEGYWMLPTPGPVVIGWDTTAGNYEVSGGEPVGNGHNITMKIEGRVMSFTFAWTNGSTDQYHYELTLSADDSRLTGNETVYTIDGNHTNPTPIDTLRLSK